MANTVDERIVEAKFDASDFESGVDKTIKKLDELKSSLKLTDSGKSVAEFAEETSSNVDKAGSALERLSNRFTTFTGMVKQNLLSGLANEISNVFLGLEQRVTSFIRSISSEQIGAGMTKYNEVLTSVRTMTAAGVDETRAYESIKRLGEYSDQTSYSLSQMTSGMSKLVAAGMGVEDAEKSMEGLANMAASAGVSIYDAQRAFVNFSQAYSSGSMRIADWQSFESLNMATQDIQKVFIAAGEAAGTLKKQSDGSYKTTKSTSNKKITTGKKVSASSGFRDTLKYGWLDQETMKYATATLSYYEDLGVNLNDLSEEDLKNFATRAYQAAKEARSFADVMGTVKDVVATGWSTSFELIFGKLEDAKEFFTWLSDSEMANIIYSVGELRNEILSAWGLGKSDGGVLTDGRTGRDYLVTSLKNIDTYVGAVHATLTGMMDGFESADEQLKGLTFTEVLGVRLAELTKKFNDFTYSFATLFIEQVEEYDEETKKYEKIWKLKEEYTTALQGLADIFGSVFGVFSKIGGIVSTVFGNLLKNIGPVIATLVSGFSRFSPVIDAFGEALQKAAAPLIRITSGEDNVFKNMSNGIENLYKIIQPVLDVLPDVLSFLGDIGAFFVDMAMSTITMNIELISQALGLLLEIFGVDSAQKANDGIGIFDSMRESIKEFGAVCKEALATVGGFFTTLWDDIRKLFGITDQEGVEEGGVFSGITSFFESNEFIQNAKAWVLQAIEDVKTWITQTLPQKVTEIWTSVKEFFFGKEVTKTSIKWENGQILQYQSTEVVKEGFALWLENAIADVKTWISEIPQKISEIWGSIMDFIFGKKVTKTYMKWDSKSQSVVRTESTDIIKSGFSQWLENAIASVKNWIKSIPQKIGEIWNSIGDFIFGKRVTKTYMKWDNKSGGVIKAESTERVKEGFSLWLDNAITDVKNWFKTIPQKISDLWTNIMDFLFGKEVSVSAYNPSTGQTETIKTRIKTGFSAWLDGVITSIKDWIHGIPKTVADVWNTIVTFFFGEDVTREVKDPETGEITNVTEHIEGGFTTWFRETKESIKTWWESEDNGLRTWITGLWNDVVKFFFGTTVTSEVQKPDDVTGETTTVTTYVKGGFQEWVEKVADEITKFFNGDEDSVILNTIKGVWNFVTGFFFGTKATEGTTAPDAKSEENKSGEVVKEGFSEWLTNIIAEVETWAKQIPEKVKDLWQTILDSIFGVGTQNNDAFDQKLYNNLFKTDGKEAAEAYKKQFEGQMTKPLEDQVEQSSTTLVGDIAGIIGNAIVNLPTDIANNISFGIDLFSQLADSLTGWFERQNTADEASEAVTDVLNDSAEEIAEDVGADSTTSPFLTAIITLGQKIGKLITETIPGVLVSAFNWIKDGGNGWFDSANGIFDGFSTDAIKLKVKDIGLQIEGFIRDIPSYIRSGADFVKNLFSGGKNARLEQAREEITKAFTDKNGNIINQDEYEKALAYSAKMIENTPTESYFLKALKGVGSALGDAFTDLGPDLLDGLTSAFTWLGGKLGDATKWLDEIHLEGDGIDDALAKKMSNPDESEDSGVFASIQKFAEAIGNFITETIPAFIKAAIEEVKIQIPKLFNGLFGADGGMTDTLTNLVPTKAQVEGMFGDTATGSKPDSDYDYMSEYLSTDITKDELIKKLQDKREAELKKAEDKRNEALIMALDNDIKLIIDNYTNGDAYITKEGYDYIKSQQDPNTQVQEEAEKAKEEAIKNTENSVSGFSSILQTLQTLAAFKMGDLAAIAVIAVAVSSILHAITDTVSVADELEAAAKVAKWNAIQIAVLGIVAILGWLAYLVTAGDEETINRAKDMLDHVTNSVTTIIGSISVLMGIIKGAGVVSDIKDIYQTYKGDGGDDDGGGGLFDGIKDIATNTISSITSGFEIGVGLSFITRGIQGFFETLMSIFSTLGSGFETFLSFAGSIITKLITGFDDITKAISTVEKIGELMKKFYEILLIFNPNEALFILDSAITKGSEEELKSKFNTAYIYAQMFATFFSKFVHGLSEFESIKDPTRALSAIDGLVGSDEFKSIMQKLFSNDGINNMLNLLSSAVNPEDFETAAVTLDFLGSAFELFGTSIHSLDMGSVKAVESTVNMLTEFFMAAKLQENISPGLGNLLLKSTSLADFALQLNTLGINIKSFFSNMSDVFTNDIGKEEEDLNIFSKYVNFVATVISRVASFDIQLKTINWKSDRLQSFSDTIGGNISESIKTFIAGMKSIFTDENAPITTEDLNDIESVFHMLGIVGSAFETITRAGQLDSVTSNMTKAMVNIDSFLKGFTEPYTVFSEWNSKTKKYDVETTYEPISERIKQVITVFNEIGKMTDENGESLMNSARMRTVASTFESISSIVAAIDLPAEHMSLLAGNFDMYIAALNRISEEKNKKSLRDFINMTSEFSSDGLTNSVMLFDALEKLGSALTHFSYITYGTEEYQKGLNNLLNFDWEAMKSVASNMISVFENTDLTARMKTAGINLDAGLAEGINTGAAIAAAQALAASISGTFTVSWEMHSPSRLFATFGEYLDAGLAKGIDDNSDDPVQSAEEMAESVMEKTAGVLNDPNSANLKYDAIGKLLDSVFGSVKKETEKSGSSISDIFWSNLSNGLNGTSLGSLLTSIVSLSQEDLDISPTITPVVDMSNVDAAADKLGLLGLGGSLYRFDTSGINLNAQGANPAGNANSIEIKDYTALINDIKTNVAGLGNRISSLSSDISNLKIYLDSGTLVGGILSSVDSGLGRLSFYSERETM